MYTETQIRASQGVVAAVLLWGGERQCATQQAMTPLGPHKPIVILAIALLLASALSGAWEVLALQAPGTPLYIGMLPGPIAALRGLTSALGLTVLATAVLLGWSGQVAPRPLLWLLHVGVLVSVGSQLYGALHGMPGVQMVDFRPRVQPLFVAKHVGICLVIGSLLELARRAVFGRARLAAAPGRRTSSTLAQLDSEEHRH